MPALNRTASSSKEKYNSHKRVFEWLVNQTRCQAIAGNTKSYIIAHLVACGVKQARAFRVYAEAERRMINECAMADLQHAISSMQAWAEDER